MTGPAGRDPIPAREHVAEFASIGVTAFTTTRAAGDFSLAVPAVEAENTARWAALQQSLEPASGLVSALQVHGTRYAVHEAPVEGWVRIEGVDAHLVPKARVAAAVTIADCVPAFIAHPSGGGAIVHAGWRGTAARLLPRVIAALEERGFAPGDLRVHLGPAICGRCYEVGPDVYEQLTGWQTIRHRHVDVRALLWEQARDAGVRFISGSAYCTRCDSDRFFSHRGGDAGRQIAVLQARGE